MTPTEARSLRRYGPWLYRLFDESGTLLYVGKTVRPPYERFNAHSRAKTWWSDVAEVTLERHPTDWGCLAAERAAIRTEMPVHNRRSAVTR